MDEVLALLVRLFMHLRTPVEDAVVQVYASEWLSVGCKVFALAEIARKVLAQRVGSLCRREELDVHVTYTPLEG